jgi:hypothetical protein
MAKTSFSVPPKLWSSFKQQTTALFLSHGPFLDHVLAAELPHVREELAGLKLSLRAKRHISGAIKRKVGLAPNVGIEIRPTTAELLRDVVADQNLVRDALFCRLLVLLRGTDKLLEFLGVPKQATDWGLKMHLEEMPSSPLKAMEAVRDDPLYYLREHVKNVHGCGLYLVDLGQPMLACYIEDEHIPGTRANVKVTKLLSQL